MSSATKPSLDVLVLFRSFEFICGRIGSDEENLVVHEAWAVRCFASHEQNTLTIDLNQVV